MAKISSLLKQKKKKKFNVQVFMIGFLVVVSVALVCVLGMFSKQQEQEQGQQQQYKEESNLAISLQSVSSEKQDSKLIRVSQQQQQQQQQQHDSPETYPPIERIIQGEWNITGKIDFLLDFAIIGFPKCGTSTMMDYLDMSRFAAVARKEKCELGTGRQAKLVRDLYEELPPGQHLKRGIKCPRSLENDFAMKQHLKYFPKAHYLVGLRHPVRWFESFYNFRVFNDVPMRPPSELLGNCQKYSRGVCTHRARFHIFLANFHKTPLEGEEMKLFPQKGSMLHLFPTDRRIFLYHVEQLKDEDKERQLQMRKDLTTYLDLPEVLPELTVWTKPGKTLDEEQLANAQSKKLDICLDEHKPIRQYLMDQGKTSAKWILEYFLKSPDVYMSSPEYFKSILRSWSEDPCEQQ